ncbi:MAG TPA: PQQ-binding-like beta-propeller repeat protein [Candidatus Limnocylindrales bacterium]|nr:PQQ-binding-like beta-propeller repeat protein [Candidatus Limnocylindrales bacterium]
MSAAGSDPEEPAAPSPARTARQPHDATIVYPGGLRARWRWGGSGDGTAVFALSEAGGSLTEHGGLAGDGYEALCRAELRVDSPAGPWTARLASLIYDEPAAVYWDDHGLLVVKYGFLTYAFDGRSGELRWSHRSATPLLAILGSPRLPHVLAQAEIETFALEPDGTVAWRVAHSDVVTGAELVGGRLVLTSFGGAVSALDPATGRVAG